MRTNIDFDGVEESKPRVGLEPGAYVCKILRMTDNPEREYVEAVWDVAEGDHAGHYSDLWGEEHPYAHNLYMSYKDIALGMLKATLNAITDSNPGFDALAAWNAGRLEMFTNRLIGLNLREEEYEYNGEVRKRLTVGGRCTVAEVRAGTVKPMSCKKLQSSSISQQQSSSAHVIDLD